MKKCLSALLALLLLLSGCARPEPASSARQFQLYFTSTAKDGPAVVGELYTAGEDTTAEELIAALLKGPATEELRSPFPAGLALRGTTLDGDGHLTVDFSEPYGGLTDVGLTLADYCVVLTVCQLDAVDSVEITVSGAPMAYRSHRVLTRDEAVLLTQ